MNEVSKMESYFRKRISEKNESKYPLRKHKDAFI